MNRRLLASCLGLWGVLPMLAGAAPTAASIDDAALRNEADGTNWAAYGRTYGETHFSPLTQIDEKTLPRLGLAWSLDLDVSNSITTPLEVDGVLYLAAGYSIVHAVDAKTGKLLWRYDPEVPRAAGVKLRMGWGIRGIAFWKGRVYVATHDGRLIALEAASGRLAWSVQTLTPGSQAFISGPPRVFNGKVIIGNAGGDFVPLRGYVTAYDAANGRRLWRFYVVPGKPGVKDGAASDGVMPMAAKTWTGEWWTHGGGGAVWNAMTYDPEFNRLYLGTGNGGPMNWKIRSPGGGDNLFVASVVALDADTGRYVWHYQTTPGDAWDYDSATDMTLADLDIDGKPRKVILHAAKNGFFYILDRRDGRLLAADKLGKVTWAERVDLGTGRPVENPNVRYLEKEIVLWPSFEAVHHWLPQSWNPLTGLMYEPTVEMPSPFGDAGVNKTPWKPRLYTPEFSGLTLGSADVPPDAGSSILKAWDPRARKVVWEVKTRGISNGGTMSTAGNLVFQGLADGYLHAYAADSGRDLWSYFAGVAVTGTPITYSVDGRQYVSITAGPLNGSVGAFGSISAQWGWEARVHPRRLLTFALDATGQLPPTPPPAMAVVDQVPETDPAKTARGAYEYARCQLCHGPAGVAGGIAPDLRASPVPKSAETFASIVRGGALVTRGMPAFPELDDTQLDALRHYLRTVTSH